MKQILKFFTVSLILLLQSCVGTDLIDDPIIAERLSIAPRIDSLAVGKEQVFTIKYTNKYGQEETPKTLTWRSSDPNKIIIDGAGKAKTLALGAAIIYATTGSATDSLLLNKSSMSNTNDTTFIRRGSFVKVSSSYSAGGNVRIQTVRGLTQIVTDANFNVSAGPSLYLLLANHTNGAYTVTPGAQAANAVSVQITPNKLSQFSGVQTWTVPTSVNPANYRYAVLYCTLGPVFGAADLK